MLFLVDKPLTLVAANGLKYFQAEVDGMETFVEKVAKGKTSFSSKNKSTNPVFKVVREKLAEMSGGTVRCNYCEDSNANQVEHIYPKNYYPEKCFVWENYCYACGPCNQPKSDKFAIYESVSGDELNLKTSSTDIPPPFGTALLIDPRVDQPLDYLFLDTKTTFKFVPFKDDTKEKRRADYTIEILGLNSRSSLVRARKIAFDNFRARLFEYVAKKQGGASQVKLSTMRESLKSEHHQTVWYEMIRQRKLHEEIDELLNAAPEALTW